MPSASLFNLVLISRNPTSQVALAGNNTSEIGDQFGSSERFSHGVSLAPPRHALHCTFRMTYVPASAVAFSVARQPAARGACPVALEPFGQKGVSQAHRALDAARALSIPSPNPSALVGPAPPSSGPFLLAEACVGTLPAVIEFCEGISQAAADHCCALEARQPRAFSLSPVGFPHERWNRCTASRFPSSHHPDAASVLRSAAMRRSSTRRNPLPPGLNPQLTLAQQTKRPRPGFKPSGSLRSGERGVDLLI